MNIIIVGGGQVGAYLASLLIEQGHQIRIIDERASRIPVLQKDLPHECIFHANGADPKVLEAAGIRHADVVAAVTGADETNLVVATLAKLEYGVRRVVGRVNNPKNAWLFNATMGVDAALNQADLMAHLVAEEMSMGNMMLLMKLHGGQYSLVERTVDPSSRITGRSIAEVELPSECVLVALFRHDELILPRPDTVFLPHDQLIALSDEGHISALEALLGPDRNRS